jgi:glycosyltransferase involved in cell wall biosynthesis
MRLLVIIPAFNEAQALPALIGEIRRVTSAISVTGGDIVVIDDASTDATAQVAEEAGVRLVRLCRNLGIGGAVQTGLRLAFREGFDCAVQMDGDGQHPASELPKLLEALGSEPAADVIVGSRYRDGRGYQSTWLRRLGSIWLRAVLRAVTGVWITDPTSGYRLYGRRALALFARSYPYDYPEPEALAMARAAGLRVVEVPIEMRKRQSGVSSIRSLHAPYYVLKVTLAVLLTYARNWHRSAPDPM